jgi:hypothetical protein
MVEVGAGRFVHTPQLGGFGGAKTPLLAVSENEFSSPIGNFKFVKDDTGAVTHLIYQAVEGDFKAARK